MAAAIGTIVKVTVSGGTSGTSSGITTATGDALFFATQGDPGVTFNVPSDSKSNVPTVLTGGVLATASIKQGVFVKENCTGGASHTATFTISANADFTAWFGNVTGVGTAPLDSASSQNTDTASAYTTTTGTLGQADNLAVTLVTSNSPGNPTVYSESTGFTKTNEEQNGSSFWSGAVFTKTTAATTALTPSVTITGGATDAVIACLIFKASAGGVSVALTGAAATAAVGTVARSVSKALTGNAGVSAVGTVGPQASKPLTGNAATGSPGSVTPVRAGAITGVTATGALGTVAPSTAKALTSNAATGSLGAVSPQALKTLTGAAGTGAAGTVTPNVTIPITGVSATGAVGSVTAGADATQALTGVSAASAAGAVAASVTVALSGVSAAGQAGDITAGQLLTGVAATGAAGTLDPSTSNALTGSEATGEAGSVGMDVTIALTGVEASGEVGSIAFVAGDLTIGLTGVQATGAAGVLAVAGEFTAIASAVWSYVLSNGKTAGQNVVEIRAMLDLLAPGFWNLAIEGTYTAADLLRVIAAVQAGKSTITALGGGAATVEFRAVDDSETRVTATMAGSERTEVTLNVD